MVKNNIRNFPPRKQHKFRIVKDGEWYLGELWYGKRRIGLTQGRTPEEIYVMIADCYMSIYDIPISRWNSFLERLKIYR